MAGQGSKVVATDFNTIQNKIQAVLGTGGTDPNTGLADASFGYGQAVGSAAVAANSKISVAQWVGLRNDLAKARQHQLGITLGTLESTNPSYVAGTDLMIPTIDNKVKETDRASFNQMADYVISDRLISASNQMSRDIMSELTYSSNWNTTITHSVTITFASAENARLFFNTGGHLDLSASHNITGTNSKNTAWQNVINGIGFVILGRSTTTTTGSGTPSAIGYLNLTTTNQMIYQKLSSTYSPNQYRVYAKLGASSNIVIFTAEFADLSPNPNPPLGTDEVVIGTVTSKIEAIRASGSNVAITGPTASSASFV